MKMKNFAAAAAITMFSTVTLSAEFFDCDEVVLTNMSKSQRIKTKAKVKSEIRNILAYSRFVRASCDDGNREACEALPMVSLVNGYRLESCTRLADSFKD